jgi:hypothetical protein
MHLEADKAHVTDAAVLTTILRLVLSPVRTVIATATNLEAEVIRAGAEEVADAEEDQEKQEDVEEDSNGRIYRIEEEEQEVDLPGRNSVETTTAGAAASMASVERMNSTMSTTTNIRATATHPASTTSTGNLTRKTTEAAEAGTSAGEGDICNIYIITLRRTTARISIALSDL